MPEEAPTTLSCEVTKMLYTEAKRLGRFLVQFEFKQLNHSTVLAVLLNKGCHKQDTTDRRLQQ